MNLNELTSHDLATQQKALEVDGFCVVDSFFTPGEMEHLHHVIESADSTGPLFRRSGDLFAIRRFLDCIPGARIHLLNRRLCSIISQLAGDGYFLVKSIYFDKPADSNWFVSYHQDLTISVDRKVHASGFDNWTRKEGGFAVQPPIAILENNLTIRVHLDDTDESNGALRVIPGSHTKGIYRPEAINWAEEREVVCPVQKGGLMVMRPLLLHASSRSTGKNRRRVVHLEFSNQELPGGLQWSERQTMAYSAG
jgi:hypothetical protein